jgi:hypothetical protein
MTGPNLNGSHHPGAPESNVTSLADARKRAAAKAKQEERTARDAQRGTASARDWIIGGIFVAMALGMLWHWAAPLMGAKGLVR